MAKWEALQSCSQGSTVALGGTHRELCRQNESKGAGQQATNLIWSMEWL